MLRKAAMLAVASLVLVATAWSAPERGAAPAGRGGAAPAGRGGAQMGARPAAPAPRGSAAMENVLRVLRTTNKAQVTSYVPMVYEVKHVNPYAIVRYINRTVALEEGGFYTFATPEGNSGKILVMCPKHQIEPLGQLIKMLDVPNLTSSDGTAREYLKMKHRSVNDPGFLATLISYGQPGNQIILSDPPTNALLLQDSPVAMEYLLKDIAAHWDIPTAELACDVTIYEVNASNDASLGLDYAAWKNGPGRNLFALGGFSEFEHVSSPHQELAGLDLPNTTLYDSGSNILGLPNNRMNSHGANIAYYYQVPSAYFDYLGVRGKSRVITKTRLSVLNGHQGSISSGEQFLYFLTQNGPSPTGGVRPPGFALDPLGKGDQPAKDVENGNKYAYFNGDSAGFYYGSKISAAYPDNRTVTGRIAGRQTEGQTLQGFIYDRADGQAVALNREISASESGVFLDVIPTIADDMITLDLAYSVVDLTGYDGEGRPQLASRSDTSTVRSKDGEEILLGGLTRSENINTTRKIPVLGSLPVIGYWFGGEITQAQRKMVVIVLKNTVVKNFNNLSPEDNDMVAKVKGEAPALVPKNDYGWDMYFMGGREQEQ